MDCFGLTGIIETHAPAVEVCSLWAEALQTMVVVCLGCARELSKLIAFQLTFFSKAFLICGKGVFGVVVFSLICFRCLTPADTTTHIKSGRQRYRKVPHGYSCFHACAINILSYMVDRKVRAVIGIDI